MKQKRYRLTYILFISALALSSKACLGQLTVSYRHFDDTNDKRSIYESQLLKLALDKTVETYGEYRMVETPRMSVARGLISLTSNAYTNLILAYPYDKTYLQNMQLDYIRFPIELGILGMRTCFVNQKVKERFSRVTSIEQLQKFTHGLGKDWGDVRILQHNNFDVIEVSDYDNIIPMLASSRFDLFCRGTNEVLDEVKRFKDVEGIDYDHDIAIYYMLPRFFYFNEKNQALNERVTAGIMKAYQDGSLTSLWRKQHQASIDLVNIKNRRVFKLENPNTRTIDFNFQKYFFDWQLLP